MNLNTQQIKDPVQHQKMARSYNRFSSSTPYGGQKEWFRGSSSTLKVARSVGFKIISMANGNRFISMVLGKNR